MPLNTLRELLIAQLDDLYNGGSHAADALPRLAKAANSTELSKTLRKHASQKKEQVSHLDKIFDELDVSPRQKESKGMKGLIEDCLRLAESAKAEPHVRDAALVAVAQHVIHDEIAGYGCARTWAQLLGLEKIAADLQMALREERQTDGELSKLAEKLNKEAIAPVMA